eukprot:SAG22_NODE_81_length_21778_cov_38.345173_10_plen_84_part_00
MAGEVAWRLGGRPHLNTGGGERFVMKRSGCTGRFTAYSKKLCKKFFDTAIKLIELYGAVEKLLQVPIPNFGNKPGNVPDFVVL